MSRRADHVSAVATGIGVGFVAFMLTWIVGARLGEVIWNERTGAIAAMCAALIVLFTVSWLASQRLLKTVHSEIGAETQPGTDEAPKGQ